MKNFSVPLGVLFFIAQNIFCPAARAALANDLAFIHEAAYSQLLNKAAASDLNHLYDEKMSMASGTASILRCGAPGNYHYTLVSNKAAEEKNAMPFLSGQNAEEYLNSADVVSSAFPDVVDEELHANDLTFGISSPKQSSDEVAMDGLTLDEEVEMLLDALVNEGLMLMATAGDAFYNQEEAQSRESLPEGQGEAAHISLPHEMDVENQSPETTATQESHATENRLLRAAQNLQLLTASRYEAQRRRSLDALQQARSQFGETQGRPAADRDFLREESQSPLNTGSQDESEEMTIIDDDALSDSGYRLRRAEELPSNNQTADTAAYNEATAGTNRFEPFLARVTTGVDPTANNFATLPAAERIPYDQLPDDLKKVTQPY